MFIVGLISAIDDRIAEGKNLRSHNLWEFVQPRFRTKGEA